MEKLTNGWMRNVFLQYSLVNTSDDILFSIYSDIDKSVVWNFGWWCGYGHAPWQLSDLKL
ncbi:hypothetical protein [Neisseria cinerea]|uniref:Uncharacterized protein n=1 Tax=Neisseria cinerea TaxID=483 RepID=A0A7T3BMQ2_NEICI|nr:hypothetical protein [Neisseria cinerea]QPT38422.1 hypothetical protein I6G28_02390 [Neisseria cinerea]